MLFLICMLNHLICFWCFYYNKNNVLNQLRILKRKTFCCMQLLLQYYFLYKSTIPTYIIFIVSEEILLTILQNQDNLLTTNSLPFISPFLTKSIFLHFEEHYHCVENYVVVVVFLHVQTSQLYFFPLVWLLRRNVMQLLIFFIVLDFCSYAIRSHILAVSLAK